VFSDGTVRDVTEQAEITSDTPLTATVYEKTIYLSPTQGRIQIKAAYESLTDTATGYSGNGKSSGSQTQQILIKERYVPYKGTEPTALTGLAIQGIGTVRDVTGQLRWQSSQPLVARVTGGRVTYTGRIGKTKISAQGFGLRTEMELEATPETFQSRAEALVIQGDLNQGANQLVAIATMNTGEVKDVSKEVVWNISNQNAAKITEDGTVVFPDGLKPVTVTAYYGGMKAELSRS
jgi:predicted RecA/RadA family phage recombinase